MKTRLLRKLRREAKKYIHIENPLELHYNQYYIVKTIKERGKVTREWYHWPLYGVFLNSPSCMSSLDEAIERLPIAREVYIRSKVFSLKIERGRKELKRLKKIERKILNKL